MSSDCPHCGRERVRATSDTTGCCAFARSEDGYGYAVMTYMSYVHQSLGRIAAYCGNPDAAHGCRLILAELAKLERIRNMNIGNNGTFTNYPGGC